MEDVMKRKIVLLTAVMMLFSSFSMVFASELGEELERNFQTIEYFINFIDTNYKGDVTHEELMLGAYRGIFEALDPHSVYYTNEELTAFFENNSGTFSGIGATIEKAENYIRIVSPIEGSPADNAGLKPMDLIVEVDGVSTKGWSTEKAVAEIRGTKGTIVKLKILRDNHAPFTVKIKRDTIEIDAVEFEIREDGIGYLRIKQFTEGVSKEVNEAIKHFKDNKVEKMIVDLRSNPGGYLDEVVNISDALLPAGDDIVTIDYAAQEDTAYVSKMEGYTPEMVVLINEGSASASEILAGAIQFNEMGTIVGQNSYGKGTVQSIYRLIFGGGFKLTIAEYFSVGEHKINGVGVQPDVEVANLTSKEVTVLEALQRDTLTGTIEMGQEGLNVLGVEQRLDFLEYDIEVDGYLDQDTAFALFKFQYDNNLEVTGTINRETMDMLKLKVDKLAEVDFQLNKAVELLSAE